KMLDHASDSKKEQVKNGVLEKKSEKLYFSRGNVFDISQTNAKATDLPELFPNKWLEGDVQNYDDFINALKEIGNDLNVTIGEPLDELGSAKGAFYHGVSNKQNHIGLNPRNSQLQNIKTLIHELGHAKLHNPNSKSYNISTEEKEFQAEMTAYSVASYFGIDTSDYSLKYLANWTQNKELKDKERLLGEVRNASLSFIDTIEKELAYKKELRQEMKNSNHVKESFYHAIETKYGENPFRNIYNKET